METLLRHLLEHLVPAVHEKRVGRPVASSHPSPQLIQLGQAHLIRVVDNHGIYIGNVQAGFNNGGGHQHVNLPVDKSHHDFFQLPLPHLPVGEGHICLRHQLRDLVGYLVDVIDPVIHIEYLAAPGHFPGDGLPDQLIVVFHHIRLNGQTVLGRLLQHAHIPDSDEAHVKCPGNGRGGQSQHIHILLHLLDFFFVGDAESLLLINDQNAQILKLHIRRQYPMGADDDIHQSFFQILHGFLLLGRRAEAAQQIHPHRKFLHPLGKGVVVLLGQNGGGHQVNHLFPLLHRLECHPDGNLRLAVSHVSADQPVHDLSAFHVLFGRLDGRQLILRLLEGEHFFKFPLPDGIRPVFEALLMLPGRVQLHQLLRDIFHGAPDAGFRLFPVLSVQPVQLGRLGVGPGVFLQHIQLGGQHIQRAVPGVLDFDVILHHAVHLHFLNAPVDAQPVIFMHHKIAHGQLVEALDPFAVIFAFLSAFLLLPAENIRLRDHHEFAPGILKAPGHMAVGGPDFSRLNHPVRVIAVKRGKAFLPEILRQTRGPGTGTGQQKHLVTAPLPPLQVLHQQLKTVVIGIYGTDRDLAAIVKFPVARFGVHHGQGQNAAPVNPVNHLLVPPDQLHLPRQQIPFLQPVNHALPEFLLRGFGMLHQPVGLIQHHQRILRKIIQKRNRIFIKIMDKSFRPGAALRLLQLFLQLPCQPADVGRLLGFHFSPQFFLAGRRLLLYGRKPLPAGIPVQHQLSGGINDNLIQIFNGALALGVEAADGIDLIPPQLDPPGIFLCQGKYIQNSAPDRKLPGHLHLGHALIPQLHQLAGHCLQVQRTVASEPEHMLPEQGERQQTVHTTVDGGHHSGALPLHQRPDHPKSLPGDQIPMDIRLIKNQIPGRVEKGLRIVHPVILIKFPGFQIIFRQNQAKGKLPSDPIGKMGLLGVKTAGNLYDSRLFHLSDYFFKISELI